MMKIDLRSLVRDVIAEALEFNNNKTFTPPNDVVMFAKQALGSIDASSVQGGGNKGNGLSKARQLSQAQPQTFGQMKRMLSFFETEKENRSSPSWALFGGDKGYAWVKRELDRLNRSNLRSKGVARDMGGAGKNKGMGTLDKKMMDPNNTRERSVWSAMKNRKQNAT